MSVSTRVATMVAAVLVLLTLSFAVYRSLGLTFESGAQQMRGVRLGMSASEVRSRFDPSSEATFESGTEADGGSYLVRIARGGDVPRARFEFHSGALVAMRIELRSDAPEARGPAREIALSTVLLRSALPSGDVEWTLLSRGCPTHAEEVARALAGLPD